MKNYLIFLALITLVLACDSSTKYGIPSDEEATFETSMLYTNLKELSKTKVLYGHQDDLAYGYSWWEESGRSDVKESTGSYPAVYGWELGNISQGVPTNLDGVDFEKMKGWIKEAYSRGGINTISWHMNNPVTGGDSWDNTRAVYAILPGGDKHSLYVSWLDIFADFIGDLKGENGEAIPIIYRPFHEHTGSWFWWGDEQTTTDEYVELWRFTQQYLTKERDLHNLIYAYSPDGGGGYHFANYMKKYPGDNYVDILGFDDYASFMRDTSRVEELSAELGQIVEWAREKDKIAAWTETGLEALADPQWFTETLLQTFLNDPRADGIAYVMTWRNANVEREKRDHFYAAHPNHPSAKNMKKFRDHELILFEDELPELYK